MTDLVGTAAALDAEFELPVPLMNCAQIKALAREGVRFGGHLTTHQAADSLSSRDLVAELFRSRATLESQPIHALAAPFGITNERTESGVARLGHDPLRLPRIEVKGDWTLEIFAGVLEKTR